MKKHIHSFILKGNFLMLLAINSPTQWLLWQLQQAAAAVD